MYRMDQNNRGHCIWLLMSSVCMIFGTVQRRFVLNTSADSVLITLWLKVAPTGESRQPGFHFRRLLREFQHKTLYRTSLGRLLNKIDSKSISKDGKTQVVHDLLERQQTLCMSETWYAVIRDGKTLRRQASVNGDVVLNAFCSRTADTSNVSLSERMMQSVSWSLDWN